MNETQTPKEQNPKNVWGTILKVIIAVASALAGVLGLTACVG